MPDQTLVVGDSDRFSIILFLDRSIDSLVYADIHGHLSIFYEAATTAECEEDGRRTFKLLGSLSAFLDNFAHKWRIYAFGNFMWPFVWRALTTFRLTDDTRSWKDKEDAGRKILLRVLYDVHFFQWKWTWSKFPLPRLVTSPRARQFLRFLSNYDTSDSDEKCLDVGLNKAIIYDVRAAKLRNSAGEGGKDPVGTCRCRAMATAGSSTRVVQRIEPGSGARQSVSRISDEAEEDDSSFVQIKPVRVQVPLPVVDELPAMKMDPDMILYEKFLKETGFYPPPSQDVLNDTNDYTKDLRSVAAKYHFVDPKMDRVVKEKVGREVYSLLVLFKGHPQRYKAFDTERLPNIMSQFQNWEIIPVERESKCIPCTIKRTTCHRQNSTDTNKSSCPTASPTPANATTTVSDSTGREMSNRKRPHDDNEASGSTGQEVKRQKNSASLWLKRFSAANAASRSSPLDVPLIKTLNTSPDTDEEAIDIESE
ncbi:hypothetical protein BDZ89DRAFT_1066381 [Hymenopellis radicata]|nr:hypothetical protein BDZ89DRAFT_1066381 [Hymenopellis radicata]